MTALYEPLDSSKRQIRVLRISTVPSTAIHCELEVASLDDEPDFTALSYCWGPALHPVNIIVNGHNISVTQNLAAALKHFQTTSDAAKIPIWIDAICINQQHLFEVNAQVAMMSQVYRAANRVHVWLGDSSAVKASAIRALQKLATLIDTSEEWKEVYDTSHLRLLEDLSDLIRNPYWKRTWILQEISFKHKITVHGNGEQASIICGSEGSVWQSIQSAQHSTRYINADELERKIREIGILLYDLWEPMYLAHWMTGAARMVEAGEVSMRRLPQVLMLKFRHSQSTDPRDKIYGLLGLLPGVIKIYPDYSKSVKEVYTEAALQLVSYANDLDLLMQACSNNKALPSWVPDFAVPSRFASSMANFLVTCNACALPGLDVPVKAQDLTSELLAVKGFVLDRVVQVEHGAQYLVEHTRTNELLQTLRRWHMLSSISPTLSCEATTGSISTDRVFWQWAREGLAQAKGELLQDDREFDYDLRIQQLVERDFVPADPRDQEIVAYLEDMTTNNDFFVTANGLRGLVPKPGVGPTDHIVVIHGAAAPFCARKKETSRPCPAFYLLAPCFIANHVLDGERSKKNIMFGAAVIARQAAFEQGQLKGEEVFYDLHLV
jgi:hypothetical protein